MAYCEKFYICQHVDEDGPRARVSNSILDVIELEDTATLKVSISKGFLLCHLGPASKVPVGRRLKHGEGAEIHTFVYTRLLLNRIESGKPPIYWYKSSCLNLNSEKTY